MAIYLFTGTPGGGKTYLAVKSLVKKFFKLEKKSNEYKKSKDVTIISNIDELKIDHLNLEDMIEKCLTKIIDEKHGEDDLGSITENAKKEMMYVLKIEAVRYFFSYEYQEKLYQEYGSICYVIDECQIYFDNKFSRKKWAREVFIFFEKHRHLGMDIYLITQSSSKLAMDIRVMVEKETRALPRSLSVFGEMKYNEYVSGMKANGLPKVERLDKKICELYKSMEIEETEKVKSPLKRVLLIGAICFIMGFGVLYQKILSRPQKILDDNKIEKIEVKEKKYIVEKVEPKYEWIKVSYIKIDHEIRIVNPLNGYLETLKSVVTENKWMLKNIGNELFVRINKSDLDMIRVNEMREYGRSKGERAARTLAFNE